MSNFVIATAAVVQAVATVILSILTWRYVKLTRNLSDSARRQTQAMAEQLNLARDANIASTRAEERRRSQLHEDRIALLQRLANMLNNIGGREFWDRPARTEPIWEDADVDCLVELFNEYSATERTDVASLATHLRWLRREVMKLRAAHEGAGYAPGQAWQNHADAALRLMNRLQQIPL